MRDDSHSRVFINNNERAREPREVENFQFKTRVSRIRIDGRAVHEF